MLRVLIAGVTGWTGVPLAAAVEAADDLELAGGIARSGADHASVQEALAATEADVLVDFTSPPPCAANVDAALAAGLHVVVGTSGLSGGRLRRARRGRARRRPRRDRGRELLRARRDAAARRDARGPARVPLGGVDYGSAGKPDVPSGTSRELAERLAEVHPPEPAEHDADVIGPPEARGASSRARACTRCGCRATRSRPTSSSPPRRAARRPPRGRRLRGPLRRRHAARDPPRPRGHGRAARARPAPVRVGERADRFQLVNSVTL